MKNLLLIPVFATVLFSCTKEEVNPEPQIAEVKEDTIINNSIIDGTVDDWDYLITVENFNAPSGVDFYKKIESFKIKDHDSTYNYTNSSYDLKGQKTFYFKSERDSITVYVERETRYTRPNDPYDNELIIKYQVTLLKGQGLITSGNGNGGGIILN